MIKNGQNIIAVIIVGGFIILTSLLVLSKFLPVMPDWAQGNLTMIIGSWITNFGIVVGWYFGSSKGSADKTNMLLNKKE